LTGSDPLGKPLTFTVVTTPSHGSLSGTGATQTYTPATGYFGADGFTFKVNNGTQDSVPVLVSITIAQPGQPVANSQSVSTTMNPPLLITVTGSDPNKLPLTYNLLSGPSHGALSGTLPQVTYKPASGYTGSDNFQFNVSNGALTSSTATVVIAIVGSSTGTLP